jgi:Flp pilus assembly protein TadG
MRNSRRCRGARDQQGAVAVEFALVVIPFVILLLGTIQFAWYFYGAQSASAAAREGARQVVVGKCWNAAFEPYVKNQSHLVTSASLEVRDATTDTVTTLSASHVGDTVEVTVVADAGVIHLLPMPNAGLVTREFEARLEDKSPGDGTC